MSSAKVMSWEEVKASQAGPRVKAYKEYRAKFDKVAQSGDAKSVSARKGLLAVVQNLSAGDVHESAALSTLAVKYANEEFIGDQLCPRIKADHESDVYYEYDRRDLASAPDDSISEDGEANRITKGRSRTPLLCAGHGLSDFISEATVLNQDTILDEMASSVETVQEQLLFNREIRQAALLTNPANFAGQTAAAATDWVTGGTPIADIQNGVKSLWRGAGASSLYGYTDYDTFLALSNHADLTDLFKYTKAGLVTPDLIAGIFGLDKLLIGKARKDTANEGQAAAYGRIWDNIFGIARVMKTPSKRNAALAARFEWLKPTVAIQFNNMKGVRGGHEVKVANSDVDKIIAAPTGFLITGTNS